MPDTPVYSPAAVQQVRSWASAALALESGTTPGVLLPHDGIPAAELVAVVGRHRLVELLAPHLETLDVPEPVAEAIRAWRAAGRRALAVQLLEIERLQGILGGHDIDFLVFKGPALAVQTAGRPDARGAGDIDVLVRPDRVLEACDLLMEAGWQPRPRTYHGWAPRPRVDLMPDGWAWRHALLCTNEFTYDGMASSVDLHWRLDPTLSALPPFDALWSRSERVDLGRGLVVPTLGRGDLLAHACLHAAKDSWRWLRNLVDVHRIAAQPTTWSAERATGQLRRHELATLAVTQSFLGLPPAVPDDVRAELEAVPASTLQRAATAQTGVVVSARPFPGVETVRQLRYRVSASAAPSDVAHAVLVAALPMSSVIGVESDSAWSGVPRAALNRLRRLVRRLAAWARHVPGAGLDEPLPRPARKAEHTS